MDIFTEISLLIGMAATMAGIMKLLKQPLLMGYIITGLIVGPVGLGLVHSNETVEVLAEFGIAILLFIVGIHLSPKVIREVGKAAAIVGTGQVLFTSLGGYGLARLLNFSATESIYIALALTFSSTIVVLKLLSDKKDIDKLYGKIAIGLLLVQDIVAILALVVISATTGESSLQVAIVGLLFKGTLATLVLGIISYKILPVLGDFFAGSQEFLFIFSIGWGLGLATIFSHLGFSVEIGALIAGVVLSVSPYSQEISARLKPLRDFFVIIFFIFLGVEINIANFSQLIAPIIIFSLFVLFLEPLIIILIMNLLGYNKRTNFFAGVSMAQISEFSLILILLGIESGHIGQEILSVVTIVAIVTIAISTYVIARAEQLYPYFSTYLAKIEKKRTIKENDLLANHEVILFGCNRVGYDFLTLFKTMGQSFLVIDFDPQIVADLTKDGINARYGDAEDAEFLEELNIDESKMIISTIPDFDINMFLLSRVKKLNKEMIVIVISYNVDEALTLYKKGATYVILPHFIGGHFAAMMAAEHWLHIDRFNAERDKHIKYLNERIKAGHSHPDRDSHL